MPSSCEKAEIEEIAGCSFTQGNGVRLLYKGRESFDTIFDHVRKAKSFVCLQSYIYRNDETGSELAGILKGKSKEGVRIYLIYDHFGSFGTPGSFWRELRDSGIMIRASRPFKWSSPLHYAHRDHRKLVIVDGLVAFTGGLNIANEYRGFHLRSRGGWRDTGIILRGPIVSELLSAFMKAWNTWRGDLAALPQPLSTAGAESAGELPVIPIFASSAKGRRRMRKLLYYSIYHAGKSITLTTAYFTPSRRMLSSLEDAVKRGAQVRLLVPGKSDVPVAKYAGRAFFTRLLKAGVRIFDYQGEMLHAKSYVFDGCWSVVGSANLDFQSLRWNDEGNVGILDEGFAKAMTAVFEEDLNRSTEVALDEWLKRSLMEKIKERISVIFRRRL